MSKSILRTLFALLAVAMLTIASAGTTFASEGLTSSAYAAESTITEGEEDGDDGDSTETEEPAAEEELTDEEIDELIELILELFGLTFDPVDFVQDMRDADFAMREMMGIIDSAGSGRPERCEEYAGYLLYVAEEAERVPDPEWEGVYNVYIGAIETLVDTNKDLFRLCTNGDTDAPSGLSLWQARHGLETSREMLLPAMYWGITKLGEDPGSPLEEAVMAEPLTSSEVEVLLADLGYEFDAEELLIDMTISMLVMEAMGGALDGEYLDCGTLVFGYIALLDTNTYPYVPPEYVGFYNIEIDAIRKVLDTTAPFVELCFEGGQLTFLTYGGAREGVYEALDELIPAIDELERRLGITYRE